MQEHIIKAASISHGGLIQQRLLRAYKTPLRIGGEAAVFTHQLLGSFC